MTARLHPQTPHWLKDIDATLPVSSHFVLHGNIRDLHAFPAQLPGLADTVLVPLNTVAVLWESLRASGYEYLLHHSPVGGLTIVSSALPQAPGQDPVADPATVVAEVLSGGQAQPGSPLTYAGLIDVVQRVARSRRRGAIVLDYLSQAEPAGESPSPDFHRFMVALLAEVHRAAPVPGGTTRPVPLHNPRFLLVDRPADLPPWLVGGSDGIRQIPIPLPDSATRTALASQLAPHLPQAGTDAASLAAVATRFSNSSEGMTLRAMTEVPPLAADRAVAAAEVDDTVRAYRVGLVENKWKQPQLRAAILRESRAAAGGDPTGQVLGRRVLGQERAVQHVLDILVRSATGLTSAHVPHGSTGPRGVLFFAGPTGVGKTELAKAMTELLFGDERAYIRFDMSEFASEHNGDRLIGSPPGYVGFGVGGELTNAVRQRPFSVVLFDEIEKAHPRILDKFLQILSDGRLTDGTGATVHFTESIIVFTSNLGVAEAAERVAAARLAGEEVDHAAITRAVIEDEFNNPDKFNRPELLGRIGDNIVIFEPISPEVATRLADRFIDNVIARLLEEERITLHIPEDVRAQIVAASTRDLSKGGRGIGGNIESILVNPLARAVVEFDSGGTVVMTELVATDDEHRVSLQPISGVGGTRA